MILQCEDIPVNRQPRNLEIRLERKKPHFCNTLEPCTCLVFKHNSLLLTVEWKSMYTFADVLSSANLQRVPKSHSEYLQTETSTSNACSLLYQTEVAVGDNGFCCEQSHVVVDNDLLCDWQCPVIVDNVTLVNVTLVCSVKKFCYISRRIYVQMARLHIHISSWTSMLWLYKVKGYLPNCNIVSFTKGWMFHVVLDTDIAHKVMRTKLRTLL